MIEELKNQIKKIYVCDACTCYHACIFGGGKNMTSELCNCEAYEEYKKLDITMANSMFIQQGKITGVIFNTQNYENKVELQLGDYVLVTEGDKTYVQLKDDLLYPNTYEGCCKVLGCEPVPDGLLLKEGANEHNKYLYSDEMNALFKLLICRNAYWKLAGDWAPNWKDDSKKSAVAVIEDEPRVTTRYTERNMFVFPSESLCVRFLNNFKDLFEQCIKMFQ